MRRVRDALIGAVLVFSAADAFAQGLPSKPVRTRWHHAPHELDRIAHGKERDPVRAGVTGQAVADLLAGHVKLMFAPAQTVMPYGQAGSTPEEFARFLRGDQAKWSRG
jgi:hypothetical protein